jgi:hypothetical protein
LDNVELFGHPNLCVFVPSTEYCGNNHWRKENTVPLLYTAGLEINGHMPFRATSYPNEKKPMQFWQKYTWLIAGVLVFVLMVALTVYLVTRGEEKENKKKEQS